MDIEDLGEPSAVCEMCEAQEIRYVHHLEHPDYDNTLGCGCIRAGRMEEDYEGARRREQAFRGAAGRRRRWLARKWQISNKGNPYLNANGYNVVVFPLNSMAAATAWGFRVTNRDRATDDFVQSRKPYSSDEEAKLRAFGAIVWMKDRGR